MGTDDDVRRGLELPAERVDNGWFLYSGVDAVDINRRVAAVGSHLQYKDLRVASVSKKVCADLYVGKFTSKLMQQINQKSNRQYGAPSLGGGGSESKYESSGGWSVWRELGVVFPPNTRCPPSRSPRLTPHTVYIP